jgi:predicted N-formylglutamate amidohydrolase
MHDAPQAAQLNPRSQSRIPVYRWHAGVDLRWLVLCDHASNRVPAELNDLGLTAFERSRHIAWDIGAADVARRLARHLNAPWIEHGISRLVIDGNRGGDDPTLIPERSDGTVVPGNQALDARERQRRWQAYHQPYHRRIDRHLNQLAAISIAPMLVSIHSFTPRLAGTAELRPWPIGVLWRNDPSLAHPLIRELRRDGTLVGDNQPYDGHSSLGHSVDLHGARRGLPHTTIELRQDLLHTPAARARWALRLQRALVHVVAHLHPLRTRIEPRT